MIKQVKKLTPYQFKYLADVVELCKKENKGWRIGQCWANELFKYKPDLANEITGSEYDPFYFNEESKLGKFFDYIKESENKTNNIWEIVTSIKMKIPLEEPFNIDDLISELIEFKAQLDNIDCGNMVTIEKFNHATIILKNCLNSLTG